MPTGIEWTDETWNPLVAFDRATGKRGWFCTKVSPGCKHCYAERMNRWVGTGHHYRTGDLDQVEFDLVNLGLPQAAREPRKFFVNSMTDLFHEAVPDELIERVFAAMMAADHHVYQVLTKRAARMREFVNDRLMGLDPFPHIWLGVSAEDQSHAEERIPELLRTPAAVRFVSVEPLLGPMDIMEYLAPAMHMSRPRDANGQAPDLTQEVVTALNQLGRAAVAKVGGQPFLDWVIVGGESGPGARPMHPTWARSIRDQCQDAGVPFFFKQWGAWTPVCDIYADDPSWELDEYASRRYDVVALDTAGFQPQGESRDGSWCLYQPPPGSWRMARVGKKLAGRRLDGREWNDFPAAVPATP